MTGAAGRPAVQRFYAAEFLPHLPDDLAVTRISRTVDRFRLVDEATVSFTHDRELPWLLPGTAPTYRRAEVLAIAVVSFRRGLICAQRILWDHATLTAQLGVPGLSCPGPGGPGRRARQRDKEQRARQVRWPLVTYRKSPVPAESQWTAEVDVTPQLAAALIREQFPDLGARQVTVLATGWDNTAFLVDGQWLFRFPRRAVAVPGVRREITVLPRLAAALPVPIPDPRFIGEPSPSYPWPFFGARLLPGEELADSGLADARRAGLAAAVGHFLRVLHDPGLVALAGQADLPVDPMRRASPTVRAGRAREVLDRLTASGRWPAGGDVRRFLDHAEGTAAASPRRRRRARDGDRPARGRRAPGGRRRARGQGA